MDKNFLNEKEKQSVALAIHQAEQKTSGEIRVHIDHTRIIKDPLRRAKKRFRQLKMEKTREHNGILIFIAPKARKFAIYGDSAIDQNVGQKFWDDIIASLIEHFVSGNYCPGIIDAVDTCGSRLGRFFQRRDDDVNELPDEVTES